MTVSKRSARELLLQNAWLLNGWAVFAAFATYFSMYMFRKPFTAASFSDTGTSEWDQKTIVVSAQVLGYLLSKIIGVRVISSMAPGKRAMALVLLILCAHLALLLFAVLPAPLHIIAIFLNGLPLGMVFGLVLGFLEGRRMTEALTAGLCVSFIVAGGFAKTLGRVVLDILTQSMGFSIASAERWMPFVAGLIFLLPMAISVWMLVQIPPPNDRDIQQRSIRPPMSPSDRRHLLRKYGMGIGAVAVIYFLATILRSLRDDFAPEIFAGMGAPASAADYTIVDSAVGLIVLIVNGLSVLIRENRTALMVSLGVCLSGFLLIIGSLLLTPLQLLSASGFMIMLGAGLYLPYVAVHTTVFERMIALTRDRSNLAFLMYVVDSLGYLGYVGVMLVRNFLPAPEGDASVNFLVGFRWVCWSSALISIVSLGVAAIYFARLSVQTPPQHDGSTDVNQ